MPNGHKWNNVTYRFALEVDTDLVGVFDVVVGRNFLPRIGLLVGTRVPEFFLGNFETGL